jgi:2-phosphosulfolactate phosphatase
MKLEVALSPPEIDLLPQTDLEATVCVVFDVLRATSSIITALAHDAGEIHPVCTIEEALALRKRHPDALLCGERHGDRIDGFDLGNSPLEYLALAGKRIITTTTNGTVALRACEKAARVLVGSLLNVDAVTALLAGTSPEKIMLVCAGTFRDLALEDVIAAGAICAILHGTAALNDSARVAMNIYKDYENDLLRGLKESGNGRALIAAGRGGDVEWCSQRALYNLVGEMRSGAIHKAGDASVRD